MIVRIYQCSGEKFWYKRALEQDLYDWHVLDDKRHLGRDYIVDKNYHPNMGEAYISIEDASPLIETEFK